MNDLLLDALAVFRLWRLVALDEITEGPRSRWETWAHEHFDPKPEPGRAPQTAKIITLVGCPWCLGFWLCIAAVACKRLTPRVWSVVRVVLASSALVGLGDFVLDTPLARYCGF